MNQIIEKIRKTGLLPSLSIEDSGHAVSVVQALYSEGIRCVEISFQAEQATESILRIRSSLQEMLIGVNDVRSTTQADEAASVGAAFISTTDAEIANYCLNNGIHVIPCCLNITDVGVMQKMGIATVKLSVANSAPIRSLLQEAAGFFPEMSFIVTGAVDAKQIADYLSIPPVVACGVGPMSDCDPSRVGRQTREAILSILEFEFAHIGINCENEAEAEITANFFCTMFGFECMPISNSIFSGGEIEVMKLPFYGKFGHIAISTPQIERAVAYLESRGIAMNENSAKSDDKGLLAVYFEQEVAGFALHLLKRY